MPAKIVMGLGFGDEGKGVTTYHLAKETNAKWVIRYNGGCQAAHNIINENGIHHTCSQIGAGFMCGSKTFHSKYTMINPLFLLNEIRVLKKHFNMKELFNTIYIDEDCPVITIYHVLTNRVKADIHNAGTTGHGIGELAYDIQYYPDEVIRIKDILNSSIIEKLELIRKRKLKEIESYMENNIHLDPRNPGPVLEDIISSSNYTKLLDEQTSKDLDEFYRDILSLVNCVSDSNNFISEEIIPFNIVFEGAQGLLLDENHGFKPYTTWSTTTSENAVKFLKDVDYKEEYEIIGVVRPYLTRHGAGPFLNTHLHHLNMNYYNEHNITNKYQGKFRYSILDTKSLMYSSRICREHDGIDSLMITHMDYFDHNNYIQSIRLCAFPTVKLEYVNEHDIHYKNTKPDYYKLFNIFEAGASERLNKNDATSLISEIFDAPIKYISNGPSIGQQSTLI